VTPAWQADPADGLLEVLRLDPVSRARLIARVLVAAWAAGVLYSRVKLGAHFPVDLFAATLMVWVCHLALFRYILPYWHNRFGLPKHA